MSSKLEIREDGAGLHFRVRNGPERWMIPVELALGGFFAYVLLHSSDMRRETALVFLTICGLVTVKDALGRLRGTDVEFTVTDDGLVSTGHAPGGYARSRIARVDVSNMLFRDATGGGEEAVSPQGLMWSGMTLWRGAWAIACCRGLTRPMRSA